MIPRYFKKPPLKEMTIQGIHFCSSSEHFFGLLVGKAKIVAYFLPSGCIKQNKNINARNACRWKETSVSAKSEAASYRLPYRETPS